MIWFTEVYNGEGMDFEGTGLTLKVLEAKSFKTPFQEITVLKTVDFGKVLVLDGAIQTTERDEFVYHEMIVHPALFTFNRPLEKVLVIGGGDGGTVRELLKHDVSSVEMVEIDREVVEVSKREFPTIASAFNDKRLTVIFDDGREYVRNKEGEYDLIIVDCSDPIGPSKVLYEEEFYKDCLKALREGGSFVTQSESPFAQNKIHRIVVGELQKVFKVVRPYLAFIPTYPSGMWSFTFASNSLDPLGVNPETLGSSYRDFVKRNGELKYYNPEVHYGAFAIPNFIYKEE